MKKTLLLLVFCLAGITLSAQTLKFLYVTDHDAGVVKFFKSDDPGTVFTFYHDGLYRPYGVAIDPPNNHVFVSDTVGRIIRYNLVGTTADTIIDNTHPFLDVPYGLMLLNGKLYWGREGGIGRCDTDGSNAELWLECQPNSPPEMPLCLVYNPTNDKIYFTNDKYDYSGGVYRINTDGTGLEEIVAGTYGGAIVVDTTNGDIFYADYLKGICRNNYNGTDEVVIDASYADAYIWGMAVDPEISKVYWADKYADKVVEANLDGSGKTDLLTGIDAHALLLIDLSPTSIGTQYEEQVAVYPNPAEDVLFFKATQKVSRIILTNTLGQRALEVNVHVMEGSIDISGLPAGMYVLTGFSAKDVVFSARFFRK